MCKMHIVRIEAAATEEIKNQAIIESPGGYRQFKESKTLRAFEKYGEMTAATAFHTKC